MRKNVMNLVLGLCVTALFCLAGCGGGDGASQTTVHNDASGGAKTYDSGVVLPSTVAALEANTGQKLPAITTQAKPEIWIVDSGSNVWTVYGRGLDRVGGISLNIGYETTLHDPVVNPGSVVSGSFTVANVTTPGVIRFAAANDSPFARSAGDIVSIAYGGGAGKVSVHSVELATADNRTPELIPVEILDTCTTTGSTSISSTGSASQMGICEL